MRHYLGLSEYHLRQKQQEFLIHYEPAKLINSHMLLCGMSGTGKSFQSRRFLSSAAMAGLDVDVFDVHDELDDIPGAVACRYSQATGYGYNPLELDDDPHTGGVNRQVDFIVGLVREATPQFGAKQEAVLRYLLIDVYGASWIKQTDPRSWKRKRITESERNALIEAKNWTALRDYYPTLEDLKSYARRKLIALTIGGDNKSITAFEQLSRHKARLNGLLTKYGKTANDDEKTKLEGQIQTVRDSCIGAYTDFICNLQSGREIDDILKYDSVDVLTSVIQRIELLNSTGVLRANPPPFGDARVRVHQIKSLSTDQQVFFVKLRLREIFERRKREGVTGEANALRHVIFLDEAHKYFTDRPDDIINVIAKEARKFGIGLWCAAQEPTVFPESFLTNVGATVLLGIHSSFWKRSANMLRITEDNLKFIRPKEVISVKLQRDGQADPPFGNIVVPNPSNEMGRQAAGKE